MNGCPEADWYRPTIAQLMSYPDWFERACQHVIYDVDPDGTVEADCGEAEEKTAKDDAALECSWLEAEVCALVGFVSQSLPQRSRQHCSSDTVSALMDVSPEQIATLNAVPVLEQRTAAWYAERHSMISASSAWKALSSEAMRLSIIGEKVKPLAAAVADGTGGSGFTNVNSPLHWGHKYEPVSTALYSKWFGADVAEYGCIRHPSIPYLGASPDGVVVTPGALYGRMLEIKNVVNRELTGIPKREYWIQMQMQMEVCDLPLCDFLECRFLEYDSWSEADADGTFTQTATGKPKGAFLMLWSPAQKTNRYFYPPLTFTTLAEYSAWENKIREENPDLEWVQRIRWRLESYSLVTVERNRAWFETAKADFANVWKEVEKARCDSGSAVNHAGVSIGHKDLESVCSITEYDVPTDAS
jgi:putative phage-type endonuclease